MFKKLAVLVLGMFVLAGCAFADTTLSVGSAMVYTGNSTTIDVTIDTGTDSLYGYQFDILYDPSIVSLTSITEGPFLPSGGATDFFTDVSVSGDGFVLATLLGNIPGVTGSGTLFSLTFTGVSVGTSAVTLDNVNLIDGNLNPFTNSTFNPGQVPAVPEPASLLLLGTSFAGAWLRKRKLSAYFNHEPKEPAPQGAGSSSFTAPARLHLRVSDSEKSMSVMIRGTHRGCKIVELCSAPPCFFWFLSFFLALFFPKARPKNSFKNLTTFTSSTGLAMPSPC